MMQRRNFCYRSAAALTLLAVAPWEIAAQARGRKVKTVPLTELTSETFARELNTAFRVHDGENGTRLLWLIRAEQKARSEREDSRALDADFERFSLVFAGRQAEALA